MSGREKGQKCFQKAGEAKGQGLDGRIWEQRQGPADSIPVRLGPGAVPAPPERRRARGAEGPGVVT